MMVVNLLSLIIFLKLFLFWLWLWQLKEYHTGRFLAHFETQKIKKILSSFWRFKYPKFTKKIVAILASGVLLALLWIFFFPDIVLIVLAPLFSSLLALSFQVPAVFWRKTIIDKARRKREQFQRLLVIGVTGSYGKTSTKEFLAEILSVKFKVLKTKEHQNSEIGISRCILDELNKEHKIFVCEMGAYNKGGIKLLCDIAKPKIGIIAGVNEQHLSTFGSIENLMSAEGGEELIESLPKEGLVIFNGNNKYCQETYSRTTKSKRICGRIPIYDIWAENIVVEREFVSFDVFSKEGERANFKVNLLGQQNVENILLAVCCAKELGMTFEEIARACENLRPLPHQMELKKGIGDLNIIDATYSANSDGVISHLEYLKIWGNPEGKPPASYGARKILIMPCLIELGKASKDVHKRIGKKIAEVCDLAIITTKDRFEEIQEGGRLYNVSARQEREKIILVENPQEAFEKIKSFCQPGDIVLLESRVPDLLAKQLLLNNTRQ